MLRTKTGAGGTGGRGRRVNPNAAQAGLFRANPAIRGFLPGTKSEAATLNRYRRFQLAPCRTGDTQMPASSSDRKASDRKADHGASRTTRARSIKFNDLYLHTSIWIVIATAMVSTNWTF
ncbi:hypothetical protein ATO1_20990 [Phaeobacter sp. 22II1-1F12B]|nr:hypothetical protein ATO1_20990 [Phaeobacter sp. 22II1-1F12B]